MTVVVDASAVVAIVFGEPEAGAFEAYLRAVDDAYITPINLTEAGLALILRDGRFSQADLAKWLDAFGVTERPVSGVLALEAYLRFGRGAHRARLNLGDCSPSNSTRRCSTRATILRAPTSAPPFSPRSRRRGAGGR